MLIGTCYYESYLAARLHYFGDVNHAIKEGAIHVGKPSLTEGYYEGYSIAFVQDGRYFVEPPKCVEAGPELSNHSEVLVDELRALDVVDNRLVLPQDRQLTCYAQIKNLLTKAGGAYRKGSFVFTENPEPILERLCSGEKIDDKKKFQFFATPDALASHLVELARIDQGMSVLEPSAGQGALLEAICRGGCAKSDLTVVELMPANCEVLRDQGFSPLEADFLKCCPETIGTFDRIVANPPFTKVQDLEHIRQMYRFLKPGGR
jgi:hypothetical protein